MRGSIVLSLLCLPTALLAQRADHVVSPGMTRAQVVAALGAPATVRTASEFTYMFYPNACGRACGMNDLVILRNDSVSDAIFRSPRRHYTGTSSSPEQVTPAVEPRRARPAARTTAARDTTAAKPKPAAPAKAASTAQIKPPARANDAKPSIPTKPATLPATPAKAPATTMPAKAPATPAKAPGTTPAKTPAPDKKPG